MKATFFADQGEFRIWLEEHHESESELIVGYYKVATGKPSMTWSESVDQALCFGWIDGIRRKIDEESYCIRFTPRRPKSVWSDVNLKKVEALTEQGLMQPAGLAAYNKRNPDRSRIYSYENSLELSEAFQKKFAKKRKAWKFFESQSATYKKKLSHWVMSAKREATQLRRLEQLIEASQSETRLM